MYNYQAERPYLFTEEGSIAFMETRDHVRMLLDDAGAFRMGKTFISKAPDSWKLMALIDRMVELGEIREITNGNVSGQNRVFVENKKW